jgi:hypothetical protein
MASRKEDGKNRKIFLTNIDDLGFWIRPPVSGLAVTYA